MAIIISKKAGGIRKLSELEIDVDKNWLGHSIQNISGISYGDWFNFNAVAVNYNINGAIGSIVNSNGGTTIQAYQNLTLHSAYNHTTWLSGTYVAVSSDLYGEWTCNHDLHLNSNYGTINLFAPCGISLSVHNAFIDFIFGGDVAHLHYYYNPTDDVIDIYADKPIRISNLVGGGGGITKLSQLDIDVDKNWAGHSITNFGNLSGSAIGISTDTGDITLSPGSGFIGIVDNRGLGYTDLYFGLDPNSFYINFFENVNVKGLYTQIIGTTHNYFEVYTETDYNGNAYWSDLSVSDSINICTDGKRMIFMASDNPNSGGIGVPEDVAFILFDKYLNLQVRSGYNLVLGTGKTGMLHIESADNAYIAPSGDFWLEVVGNINIISCRGSYLKIELNDETSGITYGQLYFDNMGIKIQSYTGKDIILNAGGVVISNTDIDILNSSYGLILRDRAQAGKPYRLYVSNGILNLEPI